MIGLCVFGCLWVFIYTCAKSHCIAVLYPVFVLFWKGQFYLPCSTEKLFLSPLLLEDPCRLCCLQNICSSRFTTYEMVKRETTGDSKQDLTGEALTLGGIPRFDAGASLLLPSSSYSTGGIFP